MRANRKTEQFFFQHSLNNSLNHSFLFIKLANKKTEELTLYILQLEERLQALEEKP